MHVKKRRKKKVESIIVSEITTAVESKFARVGHFDVFLKIN